MRLVVGRDLRQIEISVRAGIEQKVHLPFGEFAGLAHPPSSRSRMPLTQVLPQLPGMFDAPWSSNVFVPAKHDHGAEAVMRRLVGVAQTELQRMLAREKRDDMLARQVGPEIRHEMAKVVLFLGPHRTVGDHHADVLPGERADRVIGVDPGVDALG